MQCPSKEPAEPLFGIEAMLLRTGKITLIILFTKKAQVMSKALGITTKHTGIGYLV